MKWRGKYITCESQSRFDGKILERKPYLASLLKKARFVHPKIAWDGGYDLHHDILRQIEILESAGYKRKNIGIFMLFDWEMPFKEMERKRLECWDWKVQIVDCRFRPLNQLFDHFDARKPQTNKDYFIHPKWTDSEVKTFRKNIRRQNICVRYGFDFYSKTLERLRKSRKDFKPEELKVTDVSKSDIKKMLADAWFPNPRKLTLRLTKGNSRYINKEV